MQYGLGPHCSQDGENSNIIELLKKQKSNVAEGVKVESMNSIWGLKYITWQRWCVSIYFKK